MVWMFIDNEYSHSIRMDTPHVWWYRVFDSCCGSSFFYVWVCRVGFGGYDTHRCLVRLV